MLAPPSSPKGSSAACWREGECVVRESRSYAQSRAVIARGLACGGRLTKRRRADASVPALRDPGLRARDDRLAPRAITTRRPEGVHHGQNEADQPDDEDDCSGGLNVDPADVSGHGPLQDRADGDQEDCRPNRHAGLPRIRLPRVERSKAHSSPYDQAARQAEAPGFADVSHAFVSTDARAATVVAAVSLLATRGTRRPHQRRALTGRWSRRCPWPIARLGGRAPDRL
jgi:hypothetical protein